SPEFIKVQFEEFEYDMNEETYCFPWTFGYRFTITKADLENVEEVAMCPSCSLDTKNSAKDGYLQTNRWEVERAQWLLPSDWSISTEKRRWWS
uniref:DPH-type MB domain-containing protein n=1 Tax=Oncorhynchus tshawytscha TaxID=74940 RepID=A0A8C8CLI4_ONCTS